MKVKKYITRKLICRLLLFAAVVLSAVLFDTYHQGSEQFAQEMSHRSEPTQSTISTPEFCVTPLSSFKLLSGADKLFSGLVFAGSQNDLLAAWHNYRSFHLLKADSVNLPNTFLLSAHFMKFNCCHHSSPDDSPASA
ncbi:hypothetical protein [Mangrovibacterium lignilyticum]|uniref:hypothetical protein n=1 Tax=Mangrovibacterium lignilyticum TaxID=2668052 RepID=UPI0013D77A7E|nr:hypothetical protein [Mangrovibacterium lignilyticum]